MRFVRWAGTTLEDRVKVIENAQREDLRPIVAQALQALKETTGWSNKEMNRQGIISTMHVGRLLALVKEPRKIRDELEGVTPESHVR